MAFSPATTSRSGTWSRRLRAVTMVTFGPASTLVQQSVGCPCAPNPLPSDAPFWKEMVQLKPSWPFAIQNQKKLIANSRSFPRAAPAGSCYWITGPTLT